MLQHQGWVLDVVVVTVVGIATSIIVDVFYAAPQAHRIVNVALHREYSPGIVFIFSQGRKYLYHV
jgi:predicted nicotinamide N-methyase